MSDEKNLKNEKERVKIEVPKVILLQCGDKTYPIELFYLDAGDKLRYLELCIKIGAYKTVFAHGEVIP